MNLRTNPLLLLIRPANLITSATDIIAGASVALMVARAAGPVNTDVWSFILLLFSSICLYAGGIAFNDVMDHNIDRIERPERPIPSGRITPKRAALFAGGLLLLGIILAFSHHMVSGYLAIAIGLLSLVYNKWSKHHGFSGPLNMGILRGLNLILGLSLVPGLISSYFFIAIIPIIYIYAITLVSRGEVHGSTGKPLYVSLIMFLLADGGILAFGIIHDQIWLPLIFTFIHLAYVLPPLFRAIANPLPGVIRKAVMHGVLGVILMDAIWVSMTEYWPYAIILLVLLPVSQKLGRYFSVT